jgi:hypothetical protein
MHYFCGPQRGTHMEGPACLLSFNLSSLMKAKAFLIASLCAMSLSLTACGGNSEETPATDMDTTANTTETAPSTQAVDTGAAVVTTPDSSASATGTTGTDTTAAGADTTAK